MIAIIYIMGVSGSGKTTIGMKLSAKTGIPYFDGDDFHSAANKEKMRTGHPLSDEDRAGWLASINEFAKNQKTKGAIIGCSALKEKYREVLASEVSMPVYWIFLQGNYDLIKKRMENRKGHYMKAGMLHSQFSDLEIPQHAITIDIGQSPDTMVEKIMIAINSKYSKSPN